MEEGVTPTGAGPSTRPYKRPGMDCGASVVGIIVGAMSVMRVVTAMALILSGCATPQRLETESGRPEVTIPASRVDAKGALISELLSRHYLIVQESNFLLMADGDANDWINFWFTNTLTGERPKIRLRFTL